MKREYDISNDEIGATHEVHEAYAKRVAYAQVKAGSTQPSNNLLGLVSKRLETLEQIIENEGALSEELEWAVQTNAAELAEKVDAYNFILDELDYRASFYKERAKFFQTSAKVLENKAEHLRERLRYCLQCSGAPLRGKEVEFKLGKPSISYDLKDGEIVEELPDHVIRTKYELNKTALKEHWSEIERDPLLRDRFVRTETARLLKNYVSPRRAR